MTTSLDESSRPILASSTGNRDSTRMSTYSNAPTLAPSIAPSHLSDASANNDPKIQEIKSWNAGFKRLDDPRKEQRYELTEAHVDKMDKLALGAKVQRALDRRMSGQDATFKSKQMNEKAEA